MLKVERVDLQEAEADTLVPSTPVIPNERALEIVASKVEPGATTTVNEVLPTATL